MTTQTLAVASVNPQANVYFDGKCVSHGFTLADATAFNEKHNHANGEENRDGHGENLSWNNGVEGVSDDPVIMAARRRDVMALLSTGAREAAEGYVY